MLLTLLSVAFLNTMIIFRHNIGNQRFVQDGIAVDCNVPGKHSSDSTVPCHIERHFTEEVPSTEKKYRLHEKCIVCTEHITRGDSVLV
jgi:hypothetical protein